MPFAREDLDSNYRRETSADCSNGMAQQGIGRAWNTSPFQIDVCTLVNIPEEACILIREEAIESPSAWGP